MVVSDLFGASGRRFLDALVAGERSPAALAALGDTRLKATRRELEDALVGRFRDIHAFEISTHLRLIDAINEEIAGLDEAIGQQLAAIPRAAPCCTACGVSGGGHAPGCADAGTTPLSLAGRLDEITGIGECNARVVIAELGTDPSTFPTPGHAAAWARLTPRTMQSGETARPGRTGKGNRYIRGALGQAAMTAAKTDTRLGAMYRRIARKRGKQKAIVAVPGVQVRQAGGAGQVHVPDPGGRPGRGLVRVHGRRGRQQLPHALHEPARLHQRGGLAADPGHPACRDRDSGELAQQQRGPVDGDVVPGGQVRGLRAGLRAEAGPRPHVRGQLALGEGPAARALFRLRHVLGDLRRRRRLDVGDLMAALRRHRLVRQPRAAPAARLRRE